MLLRNLALLGQKKKKTFTFFKISSGIGELRSPKDAVWRKRSIAFLSSNILKWYEEPKFGNSDLDVTKILKFDVLNCFNLSRMDSDPDQTSSSTNRKGLCSSFRIVCSNWTAYTSLFRKVGTRPLYSHNRCTIRSKLPFRETVMKKMLMNLSSKIIYKKLVVNARAIITWIFFVFYFQFEELYCSYSLTALVYIITQIDTICSAK